MSEPLDLAYELHDLVLTMDKHAAILLRPLRLTLRQHTALVILAEHPGIQGRELAAALSITPAGATGLVKNLTAAGLVHDAAPAGHGNRQALRLSGRGEIVLAKSTEALSAPFDDIVRAAGHDPDGLARALHDITLTLRPSPQ